MRIDKDASKEARNLSKHKLDFSFTELMFGDPLAVEVYDRFENGGHRWHTFSQIGGKLLLVVYAYPDLENQDWVRVIGLRQATAHERKCYEEGKFD